MPNQVKDLTSDQLRRIFRDYLTGRPKERLMKKYDISEEVFWEIVGMYSKKKHPNDVGNAQDIEGPADLLVTSLDTGSTATEHPIVARNPEDLNVSRERLVQEFDYDSPQEKLRKLTGEVGDLVARQNADLAKAQSDEAREVIKSNLEATNAILKELTKESEAGKEDIASEAVERAKAAPSPEEVLRERNERQETLRRAEVAAEATRDQTVLETRALADRDKALIAAGKTENAEAQAAESEARLKEAQQRAQEVTSANQEPAGRREGASAGSPSEHPDASGATSGVGGQPNVGSGSGQGAGGNQTPREDSGNLPRNEGQPNGQGGGDSPANREAGGGAQTGEGGAVQPANTSPTSEPKVEPAKVEPDGLKPK